MGQRFQDRIRRVYICQAERTHLVVFLFFEEGTHPRAIAKIQGDVGEVHFVEFPDLPLSLLEEQVHSEVMSFSKRFGAPAITIDIPNGCEPGDLMDWIRSQATILFHHPIVPN